MMPQIFDMARPNVTGPRSPVIHLNRRYHFSASHRLHVSTLSAEQNRMMFGKCNNPFGHGHNYVAEVAFAGAMDPLTGMVADLAELDRFAAGQLATFDCANLNTLPCFTKLVPSTENLCLELWHRFRTFSLAELRRVRVEETGNNAFEYSGHDASPRCAAKLRSKQNESETYDDDQRTR